MGDGLFMASLKIEKERRRKKKVIV